MNNPKIRSIVDLQRDIETLKSKEELMCRERSSLSQSINNTRKQIKKLEEMVLNNDQFEIF